MTCLSVQSVQISVFHSWGMMMIMGGTCFYQVHLIKKSAEQHEMKSTTATHVQIPLTRCNHAHTPVTRKQQQLNRPATE